MLAHWSGARLQAAEGVLPLSCWLAASLSVFPVGDFRPVEGLLGSVMDSERSCVSAPPSGLPIPLEIRCPLFSFHREQPQHRYGD